MNQKELQSFLDFKAQQYESIDFITHDPIQIPHQFSEKKDIEISKACIEKLLNINSISDLDNLYKKKAIKLSKKIDNLS